jgi:hypothetical protein
MKNKKFKGYISLKEARKEAREIADYFPVPIYLESDGSYSVMFPNDKKAKFHIAIDKSGAKYRIGKIRNKYTGKMESGYVKV